MGWVLCWGGGVVGWVHCMHLISNIATADYAIAPYQPPKPTPHANEMHLGDSSNSK